MIGNQFWATGITLTYNPSPEGMPRWGACADFYDAGFANDDADTGHISTQGRIGTRYVVADGKSVDGMTAAIDAVLDTAERFGIVFRATSGEKPYLYVGEVGQSADLPDGWREQAQGQAARLDWEALG